MTISDLVALVPPPERPIDTGMPERWAGAETRLGFRFPSDFKDFIHVYGSGYITGNYAILNPMAYPWEDAPPDLSAYIQSVYVLFDHRDGSQQPNLSFEPWGGWLSEVGGIGGVFQDSYELALGEPRDQYVPDNYPYPAWPPLGGMLPWAGGAGGTTLFWLTRGNSDVWPVVYGHPHNQPLKLLPGTMTEMLVGWYRGDERLSPYRYDAGDLDRRPFFFTQTLDESRRIRMTQEAKHFSS